MRENKLGGILLIDPGLWVRRDSQWGAGGNCGFGFSFWILGVELGNKRKYELWHDEKRMKY